MELPTPLVTDLGQGAAYSFGSWPNSAVPTFGAGVYTVWHNDGRFIYVGMSGRGITTETIRRNTLDGDEYRLAVDPLSLSSEERNELLRLCDIAISDYLQKRGAAVYDHRRSALGYISGSLRYEVLKRAGFRCELCGTSADERAIEVDHILPRKHGGEDDLTNLQALCFKCNANKGPRDDVDFRIVREGINLRQSGCIFCELPEDRVVASNALAVAIRDNYPVTQLHTLVIPRRHAATFFDLFEPERRAINQLLVSLRSEIIAKDGSVSGFNIGMNNGDMAGQTVAHAHVHLIPRRQGDVQDPTGGVRGIIPGKARY
jgi:ATP adenylyltransferase